MIAADDGFYEEDEHEYRGGAGIARPSITACIANAGCSPQFHLLPPAVIEKVMEKRILGKNVHAWTANYDRFGEDDPFTLTEREYNYARGWLKFVADYRPEFIEIETPMIRRIAGIEVGGTPDRILRLPQFGKMLWVTDIKCIASCHPGWQLQTAGYELMYLRRASIGTMGRISVRLIGDGTYRVTRYTDFSDGVAMNAIVHPDDPKCVEIVNNWKHNNGIALD